MLEQVKICVNNYVARHPSMPQSLFYISFMYLVVLGKSGFLIVHPPTPYTHTEIQYLMNKPILLKVMKDERIWFYFKTDAKRSK